MPETIEIRIEKVIYGGHGLGRLDGQAVFIPFTAPGDLVKARITERAKGFLRAEVVERLESGSNRREPRCVYFGECGGCQLQHLTYDAQLAAKAEFVRDAIERIGRMPVPNDIVVRSSPDHEFGYRVRATAHVVRMEVGTLFGFHAEKTHRVVDVARCPLFVPELDSAWVAARAARESLATSRIVELTAGDNEAATEPAVPGVGRGPVASTIGGVKYTFGPGEFFQVNRPLVGALVDAAIDGLSDAGGIAIELYSGVGLFTIPLSRRFAKVVAVESRREAVALAHANARANGASNIELIGAPVERWLRSPSLAPGVASAALIDPPRSGLGAQSARDLARLAPRRIVYVSCDPTTLARDLRILVDSGYALDSVDAFDLFPQTFHVETIARLSLGEPTESGVTG